MTAQPGGREEDRNPRTHEEAHSFVAYVESLFTPWNIAGFTETALCGSALSLNSEGATRFASSLWPEVPSRRGMGSESRFAR